MSSFRNHLSLVKNLITCNYQWYSSLILNICMCIYLISLQPIVLFFLLAVILTVLGIAAGALIPSVSDNCEVFI